MKMNISSQYASIAKIIGVVVVFCLVLFLAFTLQAPTATGESRFIGTFWSLVPAILAIVLALITKEVYSSLFLGILMGAIFLADGNIEMTMLTIVDGGFLAVLDEPEQDQWNVGILAFLVILGIIGALALRTGGTKAYGDWAKKHIKTRRGAQLATVALGIIIFVDDYFNCLTVGSVMRTVTDEHNISRAKLAYLIDSTAAPVCIIAPVSSWAAAVTGFIPSFDAGGEFALFIQSIPYNFYALLTLTMVICIAVFDVDFGPMKVHEDNAKKGDLFTTPDRPYANMEQEDVSLKGRVIDLVFPVILLIVCCIFGLLYTGGFFSGVDPMSAFASSDAAHGLVYGSGIALLISIVFYLVRRVVNFTDIMDCFPKGFKNMVPAIMILIFAWTLCAMTGNLCADVYVAGLVGGTGIEHFLPAIVMAVACFLAFATGTSWGTFGILLPVIIPVLEPFGSSLLIVGVSACLAGAVFGDHCSPISDTTIMASAGAQCNHLNHVSTQAPYALLVAVVSLIFFLIAGFWQSYILTVIAVVVMVAIMFGIKKMQDKEKEDLSDPFQ